MSRIAHRFISQKELIDALAAYIASILAEAITEKGCATIMLSGGNTPKPLFEKLSSMDIAWHNVRVGLCDERWIDPSLSDSNEHLVKQYLFQNHAKTATFIGMYELEDIREAESTCNNRIKEQLFPFDIVVLGIGNDAHTASLFPHNTRLAEAFSTDNLCISMVPQDAPYKRMSLTLHAILSAAHIFLHFEGKQKVAVYKEALQCSDTEAMPISAVLQQEKKDIEVYYR